MPGAMASGLCRARPRWRGGSTGVRPSLATRPWACGDRAGTLPLHRSCGLDPLAQRLRPPLAIPPSRDASLAPRIAEASASQSLPSQLNLETAVGQWAGRLPSRGDGDAACHGRPGRGPGLLLFCLSPKRRIGAGACEQVQWVWSRTCDMVPWEPDCARSWLAWSIGRHAPGRRGALACGVAFRDGGDFHPQHDHTLSLTRHRHENNDVVGGVHRHSHR